MMETLSNRLRSLSRTDYLFVLFLLFVFTLPLSAQLSVKLLVATLVLSFFVKPTGSYVWLSWDTIAYLLVLLVGLLYSQDVTFGLSALETSFSFLALPLIVMKLPPLNEDRFSSISSSSSAGLALACTICLVNAVLVYSTTGDAKAFFGYELTDIIGSHPTYTAYFIIMAITCIMYELFHQARSILWSVVLILFFFVMLVLTGGVTSFVSLLLIFAYFILNYILEQRTSRTNLVMALVMIMIVVLFAVQRRDMLVTTASMESDYWERSMLWQSAVKANPQPLFGVGTGDYRDVLNDYYKEHGMEQFAQGSFNAHNQFIQVFLSNGLIGVVILLLLVGRPLYISMQVQNVLGILIIFPFIVYGMNEVFLGRYQGVVFFATMHQLVLARSMFMMRSGKSLKPA